MTISKEQHIFNKVKLNEFISNNRPTNQDYITLIFFVKYEMEKITKLTVFRNIRDFILKIYDIEEKNINFQFTHV